jgi:hypothetical protein
MEFIELFDLPIGAILTKRADAGEPIEFVIGL